METNLPRAFTTPNWRRHLGGYVLVFPPLLLVMCFIVYPAISSLVRTLTVDLDGNEGFTLSQYLFFFSDRFSINNLIYSLNITIVSVILLFLIGFPIALYLRFSRSRLAIIVQVLSLFPLFVPGIILSYALIRFMGTHGFLETLLTNFGISGYQTPYLKPLGPIIGLVWEGIPFTTLILTASLRQVDDSMLESARDVGANDFQIFLRILLPLIRNGVVIVFALNFLTVFGSYTIPYLLGPAAPEMMTVFMERTYRELREPIRAQTQAVITFLISAVAGYLYVRTVASQQHGEAENS